MPAYTAPALEIPALPERTETDPETGETFIAPATDALVTCETIVAGASYTLDRSTMTFQVTTPEPVDPLPDGWTEG